MRVNSRVFLTDLVKIDEKKKGLANEKKKKEYSGIELK